MTTYKTVNPADQTWRATSPQHRADTLRKVADIYDERSDELARSISLEMGKPLTESKGEVELSSAIYRYYADNGPKFLEEEQLDVPGAEESVLQRKPVGALVGIMPWNFPYYQVARFAGPNLMLGNTVLLKHAPNCPQSALLMEEIFHQAGLHQHLRHQRADRGHDRRPSRARCFAHR